MKELSIEEKERRYDEAIKIAEALYKKAEPMSGCNVILEKLFPELGESENERIRKELIMHFKNNSVSEAWSGLNIKKVLAWLEKQGEKQQKTLIWKHWKNGIAGNGEGKIIYLIKDCYNTYGLSSCIEFECDYIELSELDKLLSEEQGEQNPVDEAEPKFHIGDKIRFFRKGTTNEEPMTITKIDEKGYWSDDLFICSFIDADRRLKLVEPKFHEGEWIVFNGLTLYVNEVVQGYYRTTSIGGIHNSYGDIDNIARLWTIQDAKDGDVLSDGTTIFIFKDLVSDGSVMSYCDYDADSGESDAFCPLSVNLMCSKITPATKEQREQLEKAMADAGYIFNFEKKELKKIEQKPAWSEEDEVALSDALWCCKQAASIAKDENDMGNIWYAERWLKSLKDRVRPQSKQEWSKEDENIMDNICHFLDECGGIYYGEIALKRTINWLNSLRPQNTWKPSDEQMNLLEELMEDNNQRYFYTILRSLYQDLKKLRKK